MADKTINQYTEDTTPADDDYLGEWDTTAAGMKKVALSTVRKFVVSTVTATDAAYAHRSHEIIVLDDAGDDTDIDVTLAAVLAAGDELIVYAADGGATGHSLVLAGSQTFDGTNQTANFNAAEDLIHIIGISATRVLVLSNTSVTFSA